MNRPVKFIVGCALVASLVAACGGGSASSPPPPAGSATLPTIVGGNTVSINAGGPAVGDFQADNYFTGGATYGNSFDSDVSGITPNPPPAKVFNTERYGDMTYTIPQRSGPQIVTLYFSENFVTGANQRLFDVSINGAAVLTGFDIYATAGGSNKGVAKSFATAADSSGNVVIKFTTKVQNPKISAIRVEGQGTTATAPPATPTPTEAPPPTNSPDAKGSAGCGKTRTLQNGTITINSNGSRTYILRTPDNYLNTHPYRLVVAYHWASGNSQQVADGTGATESPYYGLWDLANSSTIFVAPMGLGSGQNTGWMNSGGDDVTFTDAILAQVESELCIDTTRIFATGVSYGGGMSYAIACARPDVFRGVAILSGSLLSGCDGGTKPIAFYQSHGVSDSVLDISGARPLRDHFIEVNGVTRQDAPEPAVGSGTHICVKYKGGSPKYPVEWCAFDGDHTPNPHDSGQTTSWNPAEVWAFMTQF